MRRVIFAVRAGCLRLFCDHKGRTSYIESAILRTLSVFFFMAAINGGMNGQSESPAVPRDWQTHAERTAYRETPRYAETVAFSRRLDQASDWIIFTSFGESGEGRALPLLIAAKDGTFTPEAARRAGKAVVLIQACIHAGESDGKDAGLALLRDIAITKVRADLIDRVVLLFIPIYNVDGHERFGPYNRINQNGPTEMGWRATSAGLNLNRDYIKADAPETRAWLRLWNQWQPDLFIDCHTTDGADFRYNVTYQFEQHENAPPATRRWMQEVFERRVVPAAEAVGNLLSPYVVLHDDLDPSKGVDAFISTPRFATGYVPLARNRPALLIETHMLKPYRSRVRGTYDLLRFMLEEVNKDPDDLRRAARAADEEAASWGKGYDPQRRVALEVRATDETTPIVFKGVAYRRELSEVSGTLRIIYGTEPRDMQIPFYNHARTSLAVAPPLCYIVPPQWRQVADLLIAHGVRFSKLAEPTTLSVESYRFRNVKWASASFEGRVLVSFDVEPIMERRTFPAGSLVVPLAQPSARLIMHMLEPAAPDSLVRWGFFNAIFEQKEDGEEYVLEALARRMMGADPKLKAEFEDLLTKDKNFAADPRARLRFFYQRSPYWDAQLNIYPVGRLVAPTNLLLVNGS
ncbi:MAG: peptidase M14 [Pyrinomonas sp.]|uniref:M14 family metallopeptidase n=1 Tax=Pyrinomonas sp. TaxID=2080306 RepID=UPI003320ED5A